MMVAGVFAGTSSQVKSFVVFLVPYAAARGCARKSSSIAGSFIQDRDGCEVLGFQTNEVQTIDQIY